MKKVIEEFKEFAIKGNVIELAVGVVIGTSFGKVVNSLVNDVIMPPIGFILGGVDFADKVILLKGGTSNASEITLNYGIFLNTVLSFLITAWAIFLIIKFFNTLRRKEEKEAEKVEKSSEEVKLLKEIRDAVSE